MTQPYSDHFIRLGDQINRKMRDEHVPGVAVGVLHEGRPYSAAFGTTSVDHPLPVTDDTLFQIGSITKTFTATLIMQLVEQGTLELDAPLRRYLPGFRLRDEATAASATTRHLLTHTGGWTGDFFIDTGEGDDASAKYAARMAELSQLAPLGTHFSYNNAGFYLAQHLIETVTKRPYHDVLQEMLLEPLGMEQAYLTAADVITRRFAVGHLVKGEEGAERAEVTRPWALPRAVNAVGGLVTNVKELLRYAQFHLGDSTVENGERLLAAESMRAMQTPQIERWGGREFMGLSWWIDNEGDADDPLRVVHHGGGTKGQISRLVLVPSRHFALAMVTNADRGGRVIDEAYRWCLRAYLGVEPNIPQPLDDVSIKTLREYVGRYERPLNDAEIALDGDALTLTITYKAGFPTEDVPPPPPVGPSRCVACETDRLLVLEGPLKESTLDFLRNEDGSIGWLRTNRLHRRVEA